MHQHHNKVKVLTMRLSTSTEQSIKLHNDVTLVILFAQVILNQLLYKESLLTYSESNSHHVGTFAIFHGAIGSQAQKPENEQFYPTEINFFAMGALIRESHNIPRHATI